MNSISRLVCSSIICINGKHILRANRVCPHVHLLFYKTQDCNIKTREMLQQSVTLLTQYRCMGTYVTIRHIDNKFFIEMNEKIAELEYNTDHGVMEITHTRFPKELGGHGLGKLLAKEALDFAVQNGLTLKITCSFVQHYVNKSERNYLKYILH